jgi:hypothetical protein
MPQSDKIKRCHKSTAPLHMTGRSQRVKKSPVTSDPQSAPPSVTCGQSATLSAECSPTPEKITIRSFLDEAKVQHRDDFNHSEAARRTCAGEAEVQLYHDFNYAKARVFYKMVSRSSSLQTPQPPQPLEPMRALHK